MSRRRGRPVSGVLLLDKPTGLSSNQALQAARRLFDASKAGHTGTLDPLATGLLPVCFGEATKVTQFLLGADKTYRARARLGVTTRSGDSDGEWLRERPVAVDEAGVIAALAAHTGDLMQVPSMYSALKHGGERLYALARRGEVVERPARAVRISRLQLLSLAGDEMELELDCSKGTYVRSLVEDLGEALGCGAHVVALRRLRVGALDVSQAQTLEQLREVASDGVAALDAQLVPIGQALAHLPQVQLSEADADSLQRGQALALMQPVTDGWVAVFTQGRAFVGMAEAAAGQLLPRRLVSQADEPRHGPEQAETVGHG
ncbi:MAG: tRNA pseudouridine(55) synthase TruB [Immundisolibacter sp.]|uniref:tRNA pseudouridine(55) synthase TruB n=1 Tax=Immundisolibacter sp. TaxID=1934948 RepID=UPI003EE25D70